MLFNQKDLIFETVELPTLIKNLNVPKMTFVNTNGEEVGFLFKRDGKNIILHQKTMDILQKHRLENDIFAFLFDEAKTERIYLADDTGIRFYIRDAADENGKRDFLWIHYHGYTENLNKVLKQTLKNFPEAWNVYGVAECNIYYFASLNNLWENQKLKDAVAPIMAKYLPEGFDYKFITLKKAAIIEDVFRRNDCERLF